VAHVGIVGGGQLGRMLALAGYPLDIRCTTLDPSADSPAAQVAHAIQGAFDDREALARLAEGADVVTYEFENVPADAARFLADRVAVFPPPGALEVSQDRLNEKQIFTDVGLPVPPYATVDSLASLIAGLDVIGTPAILKSRRLGYDGKGQAVIHDRSLAEDAWRSIGEVQSLLEQLVAFDREVSIVAVRGRDGSAACYPLVENEHRDGILWSTTAPAPGVSSATQAAAEAHIRAVMDRLDYVGVMALELFQVGEQLLGNEMAPRVHNTAHWTIEGAETSQFENHLRAVTGLALGPTAPRGASMMVNLIGQVPDLAALTAIPGAHVHLYGKSGRPGRKLGHVTLRADRPEDLREPWLQVLRLLDDSSRDGVPDVS
jgi:5-(carboxyamino)imidazole ribonucleotide synthase